MAKCPLGGSPGLVRGRFLSLCRGKGRKKALILQGCGLPLGGLGLWGRDLAQIHSDPASPQQALPSALIQAEGNRQPEAVEGLASVGTSRKNAFSPKDL